MSEWAPRKKMRGGTVTKGQERGAKEFLSSFFLSLLSLLLNFSFAPPSLSLALFQSHSISVFIFAVICVYSAVAMPTADETPLGDLR